MTVRDLIARLQMMDQELPVLLTDWNCEVDGPSQFQEMTEYNTPMPYRGGTLPPCVVLGSDSRLPK